MTSRRPLTEGLKTSAPPVDPQKENEFVYAQKPGAPHAPAAKKARKPPRVPLSTRMRTDYAAALQRASHERWLSGVEPQKLTDILEEAVEPWLREHGYLN
jgi:hypothetical protein